MTLRTMTGLFASAVIASFGQTASPPVSFEAASVKPTPPSDRASPGQFHGGPGTWSPGQLVMTNINLATVIALAFDLKRPGPNSAVGLPALDGPTYDIVAKVPQGASREQFRTMLQGLLVERFGLVFHWVQKEVPSYDLTVAKGGPKLRQPEMAPAGAPPAEVPVWTPTGPWPVLPPGVPRVGNYSRRAGTDTHEHFTARVEPVAQLVRFLEFLWVDRPVVDKTGLTGTYDFTLDFIEPGKPPSGTAGDESPSGQGGTLEAASDPAPDVYAALERQLGLELVRGKSLVKVLIVDHVSSTPTEN